MKSILVLIAAQMIGTAAVAADSKFIASLSRLDPDTRLEQICDLHAMKQISADANPFHPDRAKTDVISHPHHSGNTVTGTGGAFRSGGQWYQFSFTCTGSADRMKVIAFKYSLGKAIPESKWASYGLWR